MPDGRRSFPPQVLSVSGEGRGDHVLLRVLTDRGAIEARWYEAPGAPAGVIWVGGVGGGFDSPARDLYGDLCRTLADRGISSLRVRFRNPIDLGMAVEDVRVGADLLAERGVARIGAVGHSFGGAVAISAAAADPRIVAVAALASQSYGTRDVARLAGRPLLLIHGDEDEVLTPFCSVDIYRRAREPKELEIVPGATHGLDQVADYLRERLGTWLEGTLLGLRGRPSAPARA